MQGIKERLSVLLIKRIPYGISAASLAIIVVLLLASIVSRNVGIPVRGLQAYSQLFGVWITFVIMGALAYDRRHIDVAFFVNKLPEKAQYYHSIFVDILSLIFVIIFTVGAVLGMFRFWDSVAPGAPIPVPLFYLSMIVGGALILVVYVFDMYSLIRYKEHWRSNDD